jgi:PKD repeat protein
MTTSARQASQNIVASGCPIIDPRIEGGYTQIPVEDDNSIGPIALPFTFNLFGKNYTSVYVNNNGNVSFNARISTYDPDGFPLSGIDMVAPFWADVDTRGTGGVYYKAEATRFTIVWYHVGYYNQNTDKVNTFKLIITNGTDATIGAGNNVAFMYGDMQWTAGQLTDGSEGGVGEPGLGGSPATVGLNSGIGLNSCFYFQLGRFFKTGTEYIDPFVPGGVDYLDNKCFYFDASTIEDVKFDFTYTPLLCAIDFRSFVTNPQNCRIDSYTWNFGDGTTSSEQNPIHSYASPGTYTVTLTGSYACGACNNNTATIQKQVVINAGTDPMVDSLIYVNTDTRQQILSAAVTTFSDAWPLPQEVASLNNVHGFVNGTQGVWRNEGSHVYDVPRKLSTPPDLAHDGTFSMDQFNWENADLGAIPNWIKATSVTGYSAYSYEVENQDVLGVYSAALYDYGGHLPSANGENMRHAEMAFTGFEYLNGNSTGNWVFGSQPLPQTYIYPTLISYRNIAVVKASPAQLANIQRVDVTARSLLFFFFFRRTTTVLNDEIICVRSHPDNPDWSLVVLRTPPFPGLWTGEIKVNNQIVPTVNAVIDQSIAHTGKSSLKIATATTFKQELIHLDSGKSYMINAWVSVNNPNVLTPNLGNGLGIDVTLKNAQNTTRGTFSFKPSGQVIEGWQQVRGVFVCPDWALHMEVKFNPSASGTAWYDDLRLHPEKGNMRSYVYDLNDYRLRAILDEENFASMFFYDQEGNLYLTQKETEEGIKTINENVSYQVERN